MLSMWGNIMIPMYRLRLHGLYGLYGPRCLTGTNFQHWLQSNNTLYEMCSISFTFGGYVPGTNSIWMAMVYCMIEKQNGWSVMNSTPHNRKPKNFYRMKSYIVGFLCEGRCRYNDSNACVGYDYTCGVHSAGLQKTTDSRTSPPWAKVNGGN